MLYHDWLDDLQWKAILLGTVTALALQVLLTLIILQPFQFGMGLGTVLVVELCVAAGAGLAAWFAKRAALYNALATALATAIVSLVITVLNNAAQLSVVSLAFLFGSFALMGAASGAIVQRLQTEFASEEKLR